ncbi:hypothetical protein NDU88_006515 [Pleurodeles waltl]|uniref:Uncharacterized protein n=1 Tax=Pleurodeles waltl TaxID=8319 RepID=A0AAV7LR21_PLEWA|nr:hypothetical protein NDU88_006515 [Pleurodeles waltl]
MSVGGAYVSLPDGRLDTCYDAADRFPLGKLFRQVNGSGGWYAAERSSKCIVYTQYSEAEYEIMYRGIIGL